MSKNPIKEPLIVWDEGSPYVQVLQKSISGSRLAYSPENLKDELKNQGNFDCLIVLCELNRDVGGKQANRQHLAGIDMVKKLRREDQINLPVLFVSFLPLKQIYTSGNEIITAIGHSFMQLPAKPDDFMDCFKNIKALSPLELRDVQLFSCSPAGIVKAKIHQLTGISTQLVVAGDSSVKEKLIQCMKEIFEVYKEDYSLKLSEFNQKFPSLDRSNINIAVRYIQNEGEDLNNKYSQNEIKNQTGAEKLKPWKALLLDDEIDRGSRLVQLLEDKGVKVICTKNAQTALNELKNDNALRANISVIITDYRLYEVKNGNTFQQQIQGYTFLQEAGEQYRSRVLGAVIYSGMPRQFLLETFHSFRIRPEIFSKSDYKPNDENALNLLVNRILEIGDDNFNALIALPLSCTGWENHLHDTYLLYRNQHDYKAREKEVCDYCTDWIQKFNESKNPDTPMIKGDGFSPQKNEKESDTLERFTAYYKTRRLAQYLNLYFSAKRQDPLLHIPKFLAPPGKKMDKISTRKGFFSQILGLKRDVFPFGATIEELNWFDRDLGISVLDSYYKYRSKFESAEALIGKRIASSPLLEKELKKIQLIYTGTNKQTLIFDKTSYQPYLFDQSDIKLCLAWFSLFIEKFDKGESVAHVKLIQKLENLWK